MNVTLRRALRSIKSIVFLGYQSFDIALVKLFSLSRYTASMYYLLFSKEFMREHHAVLKGRREYFRSIELQGVSNSLIRRNIHRIEKGLIMRPRRSSFGESFIEETVEAFRAGTDKGLIQGDEKKWARDVLDEYFAVVADTPVIKSARVLYELKASPADEGEASEAFRPYPHRALVENSITPAELHNLFRRRRSVRWFKERPINLEVILQAVNMAVYAPSACNRQPYRFLFSNSRAQAAEIARCAGGTSGFAENIPGIIVVVGNLSAYASERDRHLIYIDGALATMQLLLALETFNVSSCCINWPEVASREKKIRQLVSLKEYESIVMLVAVGYADEDGGVPYSQKKKDCSILEDISL